MARKARTEPFPIYPSNWNPKKVDTILTSTPTFPPRAVATAAWFAERRPRLTAEKWWTWRRAAEFACMEFEQAIPGFDATRFRHEINGRPPAWFVRTK